MKTIDEKKVYISYIGKEYGLDKNKLKYIFNKFGIEINVDDIDNVNMTLAKYHLFEEAFFEKINKIW